MSKALCRANMFVGEKCKIYYPWKQRFIQRVVYRDSEGYYVRFGGKRRELRIATNDYGDFVGFEMLHKEV